MKSNRLAICFVNPTHMKVRYNRFFIPAFCLMISGICSGQNQKLVDSLMQVLETKISSKKKVDVFVELASAYQNTDSINTALYARKAIELANEIGYIEGTIDPLYAVGVVTITKGHYVEGELLFTGMRDLAIKNNYQKGKALAYYGLGWVGLYLGKYNESIQNLYQSTEINESLRAKKELAQGYNMIGICYDKIGNYYKALEYYFKSLEINEEMDRKIGVASCYTNIGIVYKNQGNYGKALEYYNKSLPINLALGRKRGVASNYSNMGVIHFDQGDYEKALEYHFKSLKVREDLDDERGIAYAYNNIGEVSMKLGDYKNALENYFGSLKIFEETGAQADKSSSLIYIGEAYRNLNQLTKARKYLKEGIELSQQTGEIANIRHGVEQLALVEKELGNYRNAYQAQLLFGQMADSLDNEERVKKITRLEAEYEFRKEKDSLQFAQKQEMLFLKEEARIKSTRTQIIFLGLCLVLSAVIILYIVRNKIIQRKKIQLIRNRISQDLHDEIGSTLSSISLFGVVAGKSIEEDPEKAHQLLTRINSNATQTIESMNDIVWAIKSENDSVQHLINRMRSYASDIEDTGEWDIHIKYDPKIVDKNLNMIQRRNTYLIFKEAVNNAIKYSNGNTIEIELNAGKDSIEMEIRDNGQGFELQKTLIKDNSFGGNGLKNMKIRAEELGGKMKIISSPGKGTKINTVFVN